MTDLAALKPGQANTRLSELTTAFMWSLTVLRMPSAAGCIGLSFLPNEPRTRSYRLRAVFKEFSVD